jgi:hypothetical protein
MADQAGQADLRREDWERDVKGFALQNYRLLEDLAVAKANAWTNSYYEETSTELSAAGTRNVKGLGRFSEFPTAKVSWTERSSVIEKYGLEDEISWEDAKTDNVDVIGRTLLRIARGVVKAVEDEVFDKVTESQNVVNINSVTSTAAWDAASGQNPVKDILEAQRKIAVNNYESIYSGAGFLWVSPKDYESLLVYIYEQGAQAPKFAEMVLQNGKTIQTFMGLKVRISNSVVANYAVVGVSKLCATWKELEPLNVVQEVKAGVKYTVRAFQYGVTQLINPSAVSLISDTQES